MSQDGKELGGGGGDKGSCERIETFLTLVSVWFYKIKTLRHFKALIIVKNTAVDQVISFIKNITIIYDI